MILIDLREPAVWCGTAFVAISPPVIAPEGVKSVSLYGQHDLRGYCELKVDHYSRIEVRGVSHPYRQRDRWSAKRRGK
jgi:hypothetical protein